MRNITKDELKVILENHLKWLRNETGGEKANLTGANLTRANLTGADLTRANLTGANLTRANLTRANLTAFKIGPDEGAFIGFKKCQAGIIAKIQIPAKAKRMSSLVGRKCRCSEAEVLELKKGEMEVSIAYSQYKSSFVYEVGKTIKPDSYDDDIRVECSHGIHFFITREEAEKY
jgi:hypothetical protein